MGWLKLQDDVHESPRLKRMARLAGVSQGDALLYLLRAWWWAANEYESPTVELGELELAVDYTGKPGQLVDALQLVGLLEGDTFTTWWAANVESYLKTKRGWRERQAAKREAEAASDPVEKPDRPPNVTRDSGVSHAGVTPDSTGSHTIRGEERRREEQENTAASREHDAPTREADPQPRENTHTTHTHSTSRACGKPGDKPGQPVENGWQALRAAVAPLPDEVHELAELWLTRVSEVARRLPPVGEYVAELDAAYRADPDAVAQALDAIIAEERGLSGVRRAPLEWLLNRVGMEREKLNRAGTAVHPYTAEVHPLRVVEGGSSS